MKANNILKVMLGAGTITQKACNNVIGKCHNLVEDKIIKGNYVTRNEFDNLQNLVIKLQKELSDIKSKIK